MPFAGRQYGATPFFTHNLADFDTWSLKNPYFVIIMTAKYVEQVPSTVTLSHSWNICIGSSATAGSSIDFFRFYQLSRLDTPIRPTCFV